MRSTRRLALGASLLASLAIVGTAGGGAIVSAQDQPTVRIGSDGFYESQLMAEIYAQALEAERLRRRSTAGHRGPPGACRGVRVRPDRPDARVRRLRPRLLHRGLGEPRSSQPSRSAAMARPTAPTCRQALDIAGVDATVLAITAGEDTNAAVVRADTAEEFGLSSISDLAGVADQLTFGLPPECEVNALCRGALEDGYGIAWPPAQLELLPALRCGDGRCARGQRHRRGLALLDAAGHRPERLGRARGRPRHPAGREPGPDRAQRLPRGRGRWR